MVEKRRYGRLPLNVPVILRHGGKLIPATMTNLSSGGMYLLVERSAISNKRPVEVIFDLGDATRDVSMRGQITRVDDADDQRGLGVQFTNLFSMNHKTVQKYVSKNIH